MTKKVLILTASYGTGHISAAKSIDKALKQLYSDVETKIVDFLYLDKKPEKLTLFQKIYNFSMEKPNLWDVFFHLTNNKFAVAILKWTILIKNYHKMKKIFLEYNPDVIISTHMYWNFIIEKHKKEKNNIFSIKKTLKYICVITDSFMIHKSWISKAVDYYFVIDEDTKQVVVNMGIKNIKVTGFPVTVELSQKIDKRKIISELGLKENLTTILVTIGLGALQRFLDIIDYLRMQENGFQLIIITGKYEQIYKKLLAKHYKIPTVIIGWTDRMADFIRVSDLVICKGGGAIVSESLNAFKPVLIPTFVPGQEQGNVFIIKKYQLGFYAEEKEEVYSILNQIITKQIDLEKYAHNIEKYVKKDSAINIARFIYNL